jgi:hypothetical protein
MIDSASCHEIESPDDSKKHSEGESGWHLWRKSSVWKVIEKCRRNGKSLSSKPEEHSEAISDRPSYPEKKTSEDKPVTNRLEWRSWFKSPVWKAIKRHRLSDDPYCRECAQRGLKVPAAHVDHREPHFGEWPLFMKYENTESLCERHHKARKTRLKK